jgi:hypothetical protein
MHTHADKTQENKNQSVANVESNKQSGAEPIFQFIDNRPEAVAQRKLQEMANDSLQAKQTAQLNALADIHTTRLEHPIQKKENNTGLPDNLKTGVENLSGYSMDDVKVHYNSDKPAQLQAHAYAQGTDIHLGPGQEKHLPHEAWHVVQQKQGRVKPTMQMKDKLNVNDDAGLEREADMMGEKVNQMKSDQSSLSSKKSVVNSSDIVQRALLTVNPQSGPVNLVAEQDKDLYMWNQNQRVGEEPLNDGNSIGNTNLFHGWGGLEISNDKFHRAHAYAQQFGGAGSHSNVGWWSETSEHKWTPLEDQIRGDNNGGNAANWEPGTGETGNYKVDRNLLPKQAIIKLYSDPLSNAFKWGLDKSRTAFTSFQAIYSAQAVEAETKLASILSTADSAVKAFLDFIKLENAADKIIQDMTIKYDIKNKGTSPGSARNNINQKVDNTHKIGDFGIEDNPQLVWNKMINYSGIFSVGRQKIESYLKKNLDSPKMPDGLVDGFKIAAKSELASEFKPTDPSDLYTENAEAVKARVQAKSKAWRDGNPAITLEPIKDGWGKK